MSDASTLTGAWDVPGLVAELRGQYASQQLQEYWETEKQSIENRLRALEAELSRRYEQPSVLGVGGSAIVLCVRDTQLSGERCAVKLPRPVPGKAELLIAMMDKEITHLVKLRHSSIVRIHGRGECQDAQGASRFPYYIMDFVPGNVSSRFLQKYEVSEENFVQLVQATVDALRYLHANSTVHLDIKPENILFCEDRLPVVADLGTAKALSGDGDDTIVACTLSYAHPGLVTRLQSDPTDSNRVKGRVRRREIDRKWDLYSLGRTILNWIGFDQTGSSLSRRHKLSPYCRKYLLLMCARLLDGHVDQWLEDRIGLERRFLYGLEYNDLGVVLQDIRKLSGEYSIVEAVPELNQYHPATVQVAGQNPTTYSHRLGGLLDHPALRRLASISQLGLVGQVYPTATHTRLEHSLGTYHNTCRFVLSLYYDPLSPLFRQIVDDNAVRTVLVSALLHDVGQFPLAHDLEEIDAAMFSHRSLGTSVIRGFRETKKAGARKITLKPLDDVLKAWGVTVERVMEVLEAKPDKHDASLRDRLLHSIIDGPMDADKLDYLVRDSDRLKVPYAKGIDIERILRSLTVTLDPRGKGLVACVGVHEKAKVAAEFVSIARYAMFSQAYWHHTVRSMKAMLARAVFRLLMAAEEKGDRWRNEFRFSFEEFVLSLPASLYRTPKIQPPLFSQGREESTPLPGESTEVGNWTTGSTMAATDAAVLAFIKSWLVRIGVQESELLDDLLSRRLYKRLFVFSKERSPKEWESFLDNWDHLSVRHRVKVYELIEQALISEVDERLRKEPPTAVMDETLVTQLRMRVQARKPVILIDVPASRPGSDAPLYYVVEAQRRALRKDERAVGDVQASEVWKKFGSGLRECAGKVRVFAHPTFVDAIQSAVSRDDFLRIFEETVRQVT